MWLIIVHMHMSIFIFSSPPPSLVRPGRSVCAGWVLNFGVELGCWTWCLSLHSSSLPVAMILSFDCGTSDSAMGMPEALFFCHPQLFVFCNIQNWIYWSNGLTNFSTPVYVIELRIDFLNLVYQQYFMVVGSSYLLATSTYPDQWVR